MTAWTAWSVLEGCFLIELVLVFTIIIRGLHPLAGGGRRAAGKAGNWARSIEQADRTHTHGRAPHTP